MQIGIFEYDTGEELFPSAEFEFYYIPIPFHIFRVDILCLIAKNRPFGRLFLGKFT